MILRTLGILGKIVGVLLLTGGLAACVDVEVDVNVVSQTTAKATMTQIMDAEFYAMVKSGPNKDEFCGKGTLTEVPDGSATCVLVSEGPFAKLTMGNDSLDDGMQFVSAGPGLVRVSLPTESMKNDLGAKEDMDAETIQMMEAFFTGHKITVRFAGKEVVETNMTLSDDKTSAQEIVPLLDMINGNADLPEEFYAVVRVN